MKFFDAFLVMAVVFCAIAIYKAWLPILLALLCLYAAAKSP